VQQVAQLYRNSGRNAQARAVLLEALARSGSLPDSHPSRIAVLNALADSWWQDGNLLKAVGYLEQAAAARATAPPVSATQPTMGPAIVVSGKFTYSAGYVSGSYGQNDIYAYMRLANLYQQLGRPDAVAAIAVKIRTLGSEGESELANFYGQHGQLEDAAAIYRNLAEQAADPQAKVDTWQSLADLYAGREHYTEAIASIQQAIAAVQSSDNPGIRGQALSMSQSVADYMRLDGQLDQADQVYRQILQESQGEPQECQVVGMYAQYLAETERGAQGISRLKDYLTVSSNLDPEQKINVLFDLAAVAQRMGDSKGADEYRQAAQALRPQPDPSMPPAGLIFIGESCRRPRPP